MTRSQIRTAAGGAVAFIGGLTAAATPFVPFIPEKQKGTVVLVLGSLSAVFLAAGAGQGQDTWRRAGV
jgi:hypothetical protein